MLTMQYRKKIYIYYYPEVATLNNERSLYQKAGQSRLDSLASFRTNQIICSLMYVPVVFKFKFRYLFAYEYKYKQQFFLRIFFFNYYFGFDFGNSGILFQILPPSHKKYWFRCFVRE